MKPVSAVIALLLSLALVAFAEEAVKEASKDAAPKETPEKGRPELKTLEEKVSYAIGVSVGRNLKAQGFEADLTLVLSGMDDVLSGKEILLTDAEIQSSIAESYKARNAKKLELMKAFLAENGKKPGVVTLPSGLQYKVITEGSGPKPVSSDEVTTHYRGRLLDGREFDSSYKTGQPASFKVTGVIKGWTEALQLMPVGSKWELYIPPELAYGERGYGRDIAPNEALIFEIELLGIKGK